MREQERCQYHQPRSRLVLPTYLRLTLRVDTNRSYAQLLRSMTSTRKISLNLLAQKLLVKGWLNWPKVFLQQLLFLWDKYAKLICSNDLFVCSIRQSQGKSHLSFFTAVAFLGFHSMNVENLDALNHNSIQFWTFIDF